MYCRDCDYPLKQLTTPRCPECGRGFDAEDSKSFLRHKRHGPYGRWISRIRFAVISLNVAWFFLVCWHFRATTIGPEIYKSMGHAAIVWMVITTYSVIAGGAFLIPLWWVGVKKKKVYALGVVLSLLLPPISAAAIAWYEEYLFVQQCQTNSPGTIQVRLRGNTLYTNRWWPNQQYLLAYDLKTKELIDGN